MRIAREEIFGPVGTAISFTDENDAIFQATTPSTVCRLRSGRATSAAVIRSPARSRPAPSGSTATISSIRFRRFGGYKQSGFGRELGKYAIDLYTQIKSVWMKL